MKSQGNPSVTAEHGPWLTASFLLGQGIFILIGAKIEKNFNTRAASLLGCLIHSGCTLGTSWAIDTNYSILVAVYGFGSGAGCGATYISNIIAGQQWYPLRKGLVSGIVIGGFGLGGLLFSPLQTFYMNSANIRPDSQQLFPQVVYTKLPSLFLYMGCLFAVMQAIGLFLANPAPHHDEPAPRSTNQYSGMSPGVIIADEEVLPNVETVGGAMGQRTFYVLGITMMLVAPGVTFVNALGKSYGLAYIRDDKFLSTVLAMAAIANALGRISWGYLIELIGFRLCFTIKVLFFAFLIALFPYDFILSSKILYTIWMLGLFWGFCGTFVLFPVYIEQLYGPKIHGIVYGLLYIPLAIASGITSFVIQYFIGPALKQQQDQPDEALLMRIATCSGIALLFLLSLALYLLLLQTRKLDIAIKRRAELEIERTKNSLIHRQDLYPMNRRGFVAKSQDTSDTLSSQKETSLGSIVRFRDYPKIF